MTNQAVNGAEIIHKTGHVELSPGVIVYVRIYEPTNYERTVLCLHGSACSCSDFDELAKALAADGCRVVSYDRPGMGKSPLPDTIASNYNSANLAILQAFMKMPGGVDMVVCSSGGAAVFHSFWARGVEKLNLKAPYLVYSEPGFEMSEQVIASLQPHLKFMLGQYSTFEEARAVWLRSGWGRVAFSNDRVRDAYLMNSLTKSGQYFKPAVHKTLLSPVLGHSAIKHSDALRIHANFDAPVLLLYSTDCADYQLGRLNDFKASYHNYEIHAIEGSAHPLSLTTEREISVVRDFLKRGAC
jgi:pimeloyl-ACP methyl ester carboxylesterase